jgi:hypothetical protein
MLGLYSLLKKSHVAIEFFGKFVHPLVLSKIC